MKLREEGQVVEAKNLQVSGTDNIASGLVQKRRRDPLTPEEALNFLIEGDFSKRKYQLVRDMDPEVFPPYNEVRRAKEKCYPEGIEVTDRLASVPLQALLNHTATRLLELLGSGITQLTDLQLAGLELRCKYGYDGSGSHREFHQAFDPSGEFSEKNLFLGSLVPIHLVLFDDNGNAFFLWSNNTPGSTRFCRPFHLEHHKETDEFVREIDSGLQKQITELRNFHGSSADGRKVTIRFTMVRTMIDMKICNILTGNKSSQTCYICKATPKQMNDAGLLQSKGIIPNAEEFGFAPLHFKIHAMECVYNIGGEQRDSVQLVTEHGLSSQFLDHSAFQDLVQPLIQKMPANEQ
jgi:hypothetical protein